MNSLSLSDFQISNYTSPYFGGTLCGKDQSGKKISVLHVCINENGKPSINDWSPGKSYHLSECNLRMIPDFRTLLEKNLILLYSDKDEIIAFSGFEKYGKISKHSQFCGTKLHEYSSICSNAYKDNKAYISSFKMMDKKTSESVKKTLMDIAWWFDKVPNDSSQRQYELIPSNQLPYNQIQQTTQPIFSQTTSVPSRKALPTVPSKTSSNITPSSTKQTINNNSPTITNTPTGSFKSLADFQGNNCDKDTEVPAEQILKTAIDLAKREGYTKFAISNSFEKNIEVYPEPYTSERYRTTYHKVKVDFFIDANNDFGRICQLILQRQYFVSSSDKAVVIQKIADGANKIQRSVL